MNTQDNKSEFNDFSRPWESLTFGEKEQVLSETTEQEYNNKQKMVSEYVAHFKDEYMAFDKNESIPSTLHLTNNKTFSSRNKLIAFYSSIAAACLIFVVFYIFNSTKPNNQISSNKTNRKIEISAKKINLDNIIKNEKQIINKSTINNKIQLNENSATEDEIIQQLINNTIAESENDEITEYLLNIGKEDINDDYFDIYISPIDTLNFEMLLENL